ncbi:MAG: 4Fe-4S binding protein [Nitrospirae bacterium]|nr:4Fe-4S binding protein [Nitrospirota bacterium]
MKQKGWKDLVPGSVILEGGSAAKFKTGSWRAFRPVWKEEHCIQWVKVKDGKRGEFDYDYCKGCGICALECPGKKGIKAIVMVEEGK